jgi:alpha-mannosidase
MRFQKTQTTLGELDATSERIQKAIYVPIAELDITAWVTKEPLQYEDRANGAMMSLKKGDRWGGLFDCAWFRFTGTVPDSAAGKNVVLMIDLSGEGLVVDKDGNPAQGLTTRHSFYGVSLGSPGKRIVPFASPAKGREKVDLWVDAGNNDLFGILQNNGIVEEACVALCLPEMQALHYDYSVLVSLMKELPEDSARHHRIMYALWKAMNAMTAYTEETAKSAREALRGELQKKNGDWSLTMSAIGHAHLDLAWLWPIRETLRKGARTFSNVLRLMEQYPEFHFCASQPQLYQWMKEHYPTLYGKVKARIAEGRWEPLAATWVEPDTNLTGGESLIRQLLYGKAFVKKEFGLDVRVLFLPDTFGYSGALPQLMKKSNVDYLITTKLTWDRYNVYPHDSFYWEGIDGSTVLVHFPPEGTYNSSAAPHAIKKAEREYSDKAVSEHCLIVYGIGDGGGGPGPDHMELLKREENLEGLPPVTQEPVHAFFEKLERESGSFHTWTGEMFLACHQGTYTTQGRNKRNNRRMEIALRNAEFTSVLAGLLIEFNYPGERLEAIWKETLLYQFHDILPGSSITRVYDETSERYAVLEKEAGQIVEAAAQRISTVVDTRGLLEPLIVFNGESWDRKEWLEADGHWYHVQVPPLGYVTLEGSEPVSQFPTLRAERKLLENELLRVEFNDDGTISSIFDRECERQVIDGDSSANELTLFEDHGDAWDFAWDYEYRTVGRFTLVSSSYKVEGPCASLLQRFRFGESALVQELFLTSGSRKIDFRTRVEWNENGKMLRASFPTTVRALESTSEIQFGHIRRPSHRSSTWDKSKYEVSAQKWIDVSQRNYGVALLKDCKYGHRVARNILDINLLRSPSYPDPKADRGSHTFTYALYPHPGDHVAGGVIRAAYELNYPLTWVKGSRSSGSLPGSFSLLRVDVQNVIVESIKEAEVGGEIVIRLYEAHGVDQDAVISFSRPVQSLHLTNLLEQDMEPLPVENNAVRLKFGPFEVHTLRIGFGD